MIIFVASLRGLHEMTANECGKCFWYLRKMLFISKEITLFVASEDVCMRWLRNTFRNILNTLLDISCRFAICDFNLSHVLRNICQRIWFKAGMTLNVILMKQEVVWRQMVPFFCTLSGWLWSFSAGCNVLGLQIFPKIPLSREDDFMGTVFKSIGPTPCILPWSRGVSYYDTM